jgi:hypothetical protein
LSTGLVLKHPLDLPWVVPDKSALCRISGLPLQLQAEATVCGSIFSVIDVPGGSSSVELADAVRLTTLNASNLTSGCLDLWMCESY